MDTSASPRDRWQDGHLPSEPFGATRNYVHPHWGVFFLRRRTGRAHEIMNSIFINELSSFLRKQDPSPAAERVETRRIPQEGRRSLRRGIRLPSWSEDIRINQVVFHAGIQITASVRNATRPSPARELPASPHPAQHAVTFHLRGRLLLFLNPCRTLGNLTDFLDN